MPPSRTAIVRHRRGFLYNGTATLFLEAGPVTVEALLQTIDYDDVLEGRGRLIAPAPMSQYPTGGWEVLMRLDGGKQVTIACSSPVKYRPPGVNTKYTGEAEMAFTFNPAALDD